jgi:hypothetical protein
MSALWPGSDYGCILLQVLVNCVTDSDTKGCNGGSPTAAYAWVSSQRRDALGTEFALGLFEPAIIALLRGNDVYGPGYTNMDQGCALGPCSMLSAMMR